MRESMNWKQRPQRWPRLLALLAQGCTVGPHYRTPAPPTVTSYTPQPQRQRNSKQPRPRRRSSST